MTEKMTSLQAKKDHKEHQPAAPAQVHRHAPQQTQQKIAPEEKHEHAHGEEHKHEHQHEHKHEEKHEQKKEEKKERHKIPKKEEAFANGMNLQASKKHCMYICDFIKGKPIDQALKELEQVISFKRVIPFKGEIPHRRQLGVMSGRYPVKAAKQFVKLLKGLRGNALVNGIEMEKARISWASANWANRPQKRSGGRFKRVHVLLKVKEFPMKEAKPTEAKK